eukprot:scaffold28308_cov19-Tisochrysis_lutea.AAC.2
MQTPPPMVATIRKGQRPRRPSDRPQGHAARRAAALRALATLDECVHVAHTARLCKRACSDAHTFSHAACARHAQ